MRFTLYVSQDCWLGWSDESGQPESFGTLDLLARIRRAIHLGRAIGGVPATLDTAHGAYQTMIATIRERTGHAGLIEFAGVDDNGLEITFVPEPDAETSG